MRNISENFGKKSKNILCSIIFFRKSCLLRENVEEYGRVGQPTDNNVIWYMRVASWIPKATYTHAEYVTHCFSAATMFARKRLLVTFVRTLPAIPVQALGIPGG